MQRDPYPGVTYPAYANDLWEAVQQSGNGCDYVSEKVICQSSVAGGRLRFGSRSYKTLLLMEVESLEPRTAARIADFVAAGGRVIAIGKVPHKGLGFRDAAAKDARVKAIIDRVVATWPDRFVRVDAPQGDMLGWYRTLQAEYGLTPYAKISDPDRFMMMNYYKSGDRDIYFVVNSSIERSMQTRLEFPAEVAWICTACRSPGCRASPAPSNTPARSMSKIRRPTIRSMPALRITASPNFSSTASLRACAGTVHVRST